MQPNYSKISENCNLWRNYGDISDSWDSVLGIIEHYASVQDTIQPFAGPGHWNDPDMVSKEFNIELISTRFTLFMSEYLLHE